MTPHAHRPEPERLRPRDALGFLVGMVVVVLWLVLWLGQPMN